jgi:hypothetical protein
MYCFQPEIIDIAVPTFKGNISSSDFLRSVYIISTSYHKLAAASDKVYQLHAHGRWFSPGTPASSTTKTGRHDIAEILLKATLNTINQIKSNRNPTT